MCSNSTFLLPCAHPAQYNYILIKIIIVYNKVILLKVLPFTPMLRTITCQRLPQLNGHAAASGAASGAFSGAFSGAVSGAGSSAVGVAVSVAVGSAVSRNSQRVRASPNRTLSMAVTFIENTPGLRNSPYLNQPTTGVFN